MPFGYKIGDDEYPEYARKATFEMPTSGYDVVVARRLHQDGDKRLTGWVLTYVGDDPDSDYSLYKPGYRVEYPWVHDPEDSKTDNLPTEENELEELTWKEPTGAIQRYLEKSNLILLTDERIVRTIERYR